ncbi:amidohydrolase family protein [Pseudorhodoferax soli]|uniref:Amidohydrolase family protein n=1 Tax=Pseudorhodoferax soli TaxID=545864 RepID=A0A368XBZ2_9BURK|nr:amidohydrolase family protein [Pseudorhodoferax soli]RCW64736.1 amidohydrolase family protein [Pseudorhodoferax soli]
MTIDAHLHCTGRETTGDVLRALDDADIDQAVLLAPFLGDGYALDDAASLRRANDHLAQLVRGHADRLIGFAVVNPQHGGAADELARAVETLGLRGAKMVPSGWYPSDARVQPVFAVAARLALPLLFHSGIFIDGRSGRFCRPCEFEVLRDHPGVRVALAHLGWPWTDEAIAVGLIDRIHGVAPADAVFRFDISFGPPPPYRLEVLRRALDVLGPESLQFGSDCFLPCSGQHIAERRGWVEDLLDQLGLDAAARHQVFTATAATWLRLPPAAPRTARAPAAAPACAAAAPRPAAGSLRSGWLGASGRIGPLCC